MKTALIHDWLISPIGGSENTLQEILSLFAAPIYTLIHNEQAFQGTSFEPATIKTSFIQHLPFAQSAFRAYLPLFPTAIERFNLSDYELIISSSHCVAKGIKKRPDQLHICYCHTPMRYAWDLSQDYLKEANLDHGFKGILARWCLSYLRNWDQATSFTVDHFIANSHFVADRIKRHYNKQATVIYPPVDTNFFSLSEKKEKFYLTSSRLVSYKKIDLIVEAFTQMPDLTLIVIGDGPQASLIKQKATKNIEFLGFQSNEILRTYLQKAKAFVFAAIEDFGIAPIEAMACGTPVIALKKGGTAETVVDQKTGLFFQEQTPKDIIEAIRTFELNYDLFNPAEISRYAKSFSKERFRREFDGFVKAAKA